jgi:hypothetical protein
MYQNFRLEFKNTIRIRTANQIHIVIMSLVIKSSLAPKLTIKLSENRNNILIYEIIG